MRWIDIEDEADLVGDLHIETFPTLLIADDDHVCFAGPLTPQPQTLKRVLRAHPTDAMAAKVPAEISALAARLREHG